MCGIVGFLDKQGGRPLGQTLLAMLQALGCRGPDSAGLAVFSFPGDADWHLRLQGPSGMPPDEVIGTLRELRDELGITIHRDYQNGVFDALLTTPLLGPDVERRLEERLPGAEIICLGQRLNLAKQVGSPDELEKTYHVSRWTGTHGIGHTRLSTESRVDLSHSQPFWAHGVPDLVTVHNGHVTNYHKLRRQYEQRGYRFYTENDSEVIGVYLRDRMAKGLSFGDALRSSMDDFDGSYCYLAATAGKLAYVKDRFGFKPLVVAETEEFVAIATEEIALRKALGDGFAAGEAAPGTLKIWDLAPQGVRHAVAGR
jgi:glutamine phosphoribosylpyrophosphate amidotransferase